MDVLRRITALLAMIALIGLLLLLICWPLALAALILYRHRINIERLATGKELKITAH